MLKNGIYEQIVNTRINKELQQLDREKYDIELEKLDGEDARRILTGMMPLLKPLTLKTQTVMKS